MADNKVKTLSENQQRNSVSGKKKGKGSNRSVRLVLAKPYSGFWPLVDAGAESEVIALLESLLPAIRKPITADDRKLLRGMLGKKRKTDRDELTKKIWERSPQASDLRNFLIIGVNDVSRSLEENTLASLLISNEADPPILTKHLGTLAATRNVPHIVLQNLKITMKKCVDFPSLAVGFKKVVAEDNSNHFHVVHLKIVSVFQTVVQPLSHDLREDSVLSSVKESSPVVTKVQACNPASLHLTRSSSKYRAFIPGQGLQEKSGSSWMPYISLSTSDKSGPAGSQTEVPKPILGSTVVPGVKSFLQRVREAKQGLGQAQLSSTEMTTGSFLSLSNDHDGKDELEELPAQPAKAPKPIKRYFSSLAPLKVKRIQGNPQKEKKKKGKGKM